MSKGTAMKRVTDPADPRRCKHSFPHEQCWNEAPEPGKNCTAHGGRDMIEENEKRLYQLAEVDDRAKLAHFSTHERIKSLREEIGLVRLLIEKRMNLIKNEADLLAACGPLNSMFLTLEKLIKSCHSLEQSLGELLTRDTVVRLGQTLCNIVIEELQGMEGHEEVIDRIVERLFPTINSTRNSEILKLSL